MKGRTRRKFDKAFKLKVVELPKGVIPLARLLVISTFPLTWSGAGIGNMQQKAMAVLQETGSSCQALNSVRSPYRTKPLKMRKLKEIS